MNAAEARLERNPETQAVLAEAEADIDNAVEIEVAEEPSWAEQFAKTMRASEATGHAKAAVQDAAEKAEEEEEVDLDKMEVVPNRKAKRAAYNLRGSIQVGRSRVRRRIHRQLVKRGYWS